MSQLETLRGHHVVSLHNRILFLRVKNYTTSTNMSLVPCCLFFHGSSFYYVEAVLVFIFMLSQLVGVDFC